MKNNMSLKTRITYIDNMRGIAILLVMLGHSISTVSEPLNQFILSFHMPIFFFISGLCTSNKKQSFFAMLKKSVFTMFIPIITMGLINIAVSILIDVIVTRNLLWQDVKYLSAFANWFLWSMLVVKILHWIKEKIPYKWIYLITAVIELAGAVCLYIFNINAGILMQALVGAFFFDIGIILKNMLNSMESQKFGGGGVLIIAIFSVLCFLSRMNTPIMMYSNDYGNIAVFFVTSTLGIAVVFGVSKILNENKFLNFCSDNSIILYMIHPAILRFLHKLTSVLFGGIYVYPNYFVTFGLLIVIAVPITWIIRRTIPFLFGKTKEK